MKRQILARVLGASLLLAAPLAAQVPTPESVFGHKVGADFKLIDYDESIRWFQAAAAKTDKMKLFDVGKTSNGHAWTLAVISAPANLARLKELTDIAQRIAHPAGLSDA